MHPEEYRAAREIVRRVAASTIDISHYEQTAQRLARLLEILMQGGSGSMFAYFHENIDPRKQGHPAFFRGMCMDLNAQMDCIEKINAEASRRAVIAPACFRKNTGSETPPQ